MPYQYETLSRRRPRTGYSEMITAEAPTAKSRYYNTKAYKLSERGLAQEKTQFDEQMALQQRKIKEQQAQAQRAQNISAAGSTGLMAAAAGAGPIGIGLAAVGGWLMSDASKYCTEIKRYFPELVTKEDLKTMLKLRNWIEKAYPKWVEFYDKTAPIALANMHHNLGTNQYKGVLNRLRKELFKKIPDYIESGDMHKAFLSYKQIILPVILRYAQKFIGDAQKAIIAEKDAYIAKAKMPEVTNA